MKNKLALFIVASFLFSVCLLPFSVYAEDLYVDESKITVSVSTLNSSGSTSAYSVLTENVLLSVPEHSAEGSVTSGSFRLKFSSDTFIVGARYYFNFILYTGPDASYETMSSGLAGFYTEDESTLTNYIYWGEDIFISSQIDSVEYPNMFSDITSEEYVSGAVHLYGSFVPATDTGSFYIELPILNGSTVVDIGYCHMGFYANSEEATVTLLSSINGWFEKTYVFLSSVLVQIRDKLDTGFSTLHTDLVSLGEKFDNAFSMSEEEAAMFEEMEEAAASAKEESEKQNQQIQEDLNNKREELEDVQSKENQAEEKVEELQASADTGSMKEVNNQVDSWLADGATGYTAGLVWWGEAFDEILRFEPVVFILYITVFMAILLIIFKAMARSIVGGELQRRAEVKASERSRANAAAAAARSRDYSSRRSMY